MNGPSRPFQEGGYGVAKEGLTSMPQMQRTGGICRYKLHHDGSLAAHSGSAEALVLGQDQGDDTRHSHGGETEVQESWSGDFHRHQPGSGEIQTLDDLPGQVSRCFLKPGSEGEGKIRGPVSVGGIPGSFQVDFGLGNPHFQEGLLEGCPYQCFRHGSLGFSL